MIHPVIDANMIKGILGAILAGVSPWLEIETWFMFGDMVGEIGGRVIQGIAAVGGVYLLVLSIKHKRMQIDTEKRNQKKG